MRLLVTALFAPTLPLIRYELSDGVRLHTEACPCGRPFARITGVDGRVSETLWLRSAQGESVTISPVVIHEVMDVAEVTGWQLLQEPDRLCLRVVIPEGGDGPARVAAPKADRSPGTARRRRTAHRRRVGICDRTRTREQGRAHQAAGRELAVWPARSGATKAAIQRRANGPFRMWLPTLA